MEQQRPVIRSPALRLVPAGFAIKGPPAVSPVPVEPQRIMAAEADGQERHRPEPLVAPLAQRSETPDTEHARPRKRTRRACDKCSASRTRCDGE
ncbi:hypothetical protein M440DRAFT_1201733 [Trichoderma longibrachiatum ATCC 18648]|uniref:Uncharacterized protein n=1 Tax=Trichoderma longibrachiatum ATCC 18648 TaxID=983965 RepID=A0A2T4CB50_TRILO|nr:hypothetical protein M440DRAFT_1201733 [Trichoderma longibrachiatum ATCC 18648]